jgi:hypothetical protein
VSDSFTDEALRSVIAEARALHWYRDEVKRLRDEVDQYERFFRSRMVGHLVACTEGNGCQCGIMDLPLWGKPKKQIP